MNKCGSHPHIRPETCINLTAWIEAGVKGEAVMEVEPEPKPEKTLSGWLICPVCEKTVASERGLKIHMTRVHGKKKGEEE